METYQVIASTENHVSLRAALQSQFIDRKEIIKTHHQVVGPMAKTICQFDRLGGICRFAILDAFHEIQSALL
jgi:hypothetical protein